MLTFQVQGVFTNFIYDTTLIKMIQKYSQDEPTVVVLLFSWGGGGQLHTGVPAHSPAGFVGKPEVLFRSVLRAPELFW